MITTISPLLIRLLTVASGALAILLLGHELELNLPTIEHWIQSLGPAAPIGFVGLFVTITPLFVSVDVLCFAAGLLFPLGAGEFYIIISTYLAAAMIFLLGRSLLRKKIAGFIAKYKKFAALDALLGNQAFKLMFLLRLTPLPFALLSYAFAVTQVRFRPYLAATSGILIYNMTLVYLGYTTKHIAGLVSGHSTHPPVSYPLLSAGLLFMLGILFYVSNLAHKTLQKLHVENGEELTR